MTVLQVYLIPKASRGPTLGEGTMYVTGLYLCQYLDQACKGGGFERSDFHWSGSANQVTERDLVCYLVASQFNSIVQKQGIPGGLGAGGSTGWSTKSHAMVCEVYFDAVDGDANLSRLLANLIFHELMHNKLDSHPSAYVLDDVHGIQGGKLSKPSVNSSMRPSTSDIAWMRKGLQKRFKQYTGSM